MTEYDDLFDDLITSETGWWTGFNFRLGELADNGIGQEVLWPVDDLIGAKTYVSCPGRGTHLKIVDCWMCFGDWAFGGMDLGDLLDADEGEQ